MTCVLILNRITGKNYGFLKLSYFSYFQGGRNLHKFSTMPTISAKAISHIKKVLSTSILYRYIFYELYSFIVIVLES